MRRLVDVVVAGAGLLMLSPILALAAAMVRVWMGSPVLFRQVRPGLYEKPFTILKLRTMRDVLDADGAPAADIDRLTRLGRLLRATSVDELPQLWNVVRGDMTLIGPRPLLMEYLPRYTPDQARRHDVVPGVTGWAQVNGRNAVAWEERLRMDVWYVDNRSLWLDLRILRLTVRNIILRQGISQQGRATVDRFRGSDQRAGARVPEAQLQSSAGT